MISIYTKQEIIISSHREGKSQRQIARDLQISRKTIRKYLQEHVEALKSAACKETGHSANLSVSPAYKMIAARSKLKLTGLQLAVFTAAYSNYRYAFIYERQDTLAFMESHVCFFEMLGSVCRKMVYDNMRVAVSRFVGLHEKEPTRALLQLRGHYQFSHGFCNICRGNEKGHGERSVEYVRRKAFAPKMPSAVSGRPSNGLKAH